MVQSDASDAEHLPRYRCQRSAARTVEAAALAPAIVLTTPGRKPRGLPAFPSNDSGILLARAMWWQAQDLTANLSASLPVRKRALSSAVYPPSRLETRPAWQPAQ
jgi:hypothetical protein